MYRYRERLQYATVLPYNRLPECGGGGLFQIIDGQHRHQVSKQTGNPVYYVICNTLTLKQIALLNSRGDKWKQSDFLNCYIKLGIADYKELRKVSIQYKLSLGVAADLLMFNKAKARSTEIFQSGEFKCNYLQETTELLNLAKSVFERYNFAMDRYLLAALQTLREKGLCDFDRLKQKIAAAPNIMCKQPDPKQYLNNIEQVYNYKDSIRKTIF